MHRRCHSPGLIAADDDPMRVCLAPLEVLRDMLGVSSRSEMLAHDDTISMLLLDCLGLAVEPLRDTDPFGRACS